jgi:outer membrane protein OmpA-like peptidoglycan-associated protein
MSLSVRGAWSVVHGGSSAGGRAWCVVRGGIVFGLLTTTITHAAVPPDHRNFVACPIVRDTATVPCWLAEYEGQLYFLTLQTDVSAPVNPPWLGHRVLVEGVVSEEPNICGGKVLKPVVLSVLPELDASCNTILPAEERYNLTFEAPRPPGPSGGRLAFGNPTPRGTVAAPSGPKTITMQYSFDGTVIFRHAQALQQILEVAQQSKAVRVEITGYRAASLLSNGTTMTENPRIGQRRAEQVAQLLKDAGLTNVEYRVRWQEAPRPDGIDDAAYRRVEVTVR